MLVPKLKKNISARVTEIVTNVIVFVRSILFTMKPIIKIDIISDVVCPWCYIGKRRLEKAITQLVDQFEFELEYHPFELNPEMPETGVNQKEYLTKKFGSETKFNELTKQTTRVAAEEGLQFDFSKQHVTPNTRKMHCIIRASKEEGKQLALTEAFFKAYFTDGIDLSQKENLISIAVNMGLQKENIEKLLADEIALAEVSLAQMEMQKLGIQAVPFYIINDRYGVSGAQASETFVRTLEEIGAEAALGEAASCNVDGTC
jgi:predicted DsbA family dithiol-disulfide isomerase